MQNLSNLSLLKRCSYINGRWMDSENTLSVINPATETTIAEVCEVTASQIEQAISDAATAVAQWQLLDYGLRSEKLLLWRDLLLENQQDLARILTLEQGKPFSEAIGEISHAANYLQTYANQHSIFEAPETINAERNQNAKVYRRSIGVVTAITPWNFPCAMVIRKVGAALAAGCSFVLKPSELTPLSALALAQLAEQAGIPAGVFSVVVGSNAQAIGEILTQHAKVAKFSFTGSTLVGKKLLQQCAMGVKRTSMELGGNAPFIVFEDADLDAAVEGTFACKFRNSGQTCVSANRFIIHENIAKEFKRKLQIKMKSLVVGNNGQSEFHIGPLINRRALDKINGLLDQALTLGAKIIEGGKEIESKGYFFEPTIIEDITPEMEIFKREIFGPVVSIITFETDEEAIRLANQTELGLCGYLYTKKQSRIATIAQQIQVGMLGINQGRLSNTESPFGGVKQSGMGREGGRYGVEEYLDYQFVCADFAS